MTLLSRLCASAWLAVVRRALARAVMCAGLAGAWPALLAAQPAAAPSAEAPVAVIRPPRLLQFAAAEYPAAARSEGLSGRVELELVVGADGAVHDAKVSASAGHGFDEAALAAAWQLSFEPASRAGEPVAARVSFPYVFEWQAPAPLAPEAAPPPASARLEGRVLNADDDTPLAGVELIVSGAGAPARRTLSDGSGHFVLAELAPGVYEVGLSKPEWLRQDSAEALGAGEVTALVYRLQPAPDPEAFRAVARVPPPPREVTRRSIAKAELTRIPGTRGDALRTVEILPGVARPPFGSGQLIVRGSAPTDTQVFLEGVPVPLLYHFGGLTSLINSDLLSRLDF